MSEEKRIQHRLPALFVGDVNVDLILAGLESLPQTDKEIICEGCELVMGSTAVIAACAHASMGGRTSFLGLAGHDDYGEFMLRGMREFGIDTSLIRRTPETGTGITVNLIYARTRTQITYPGTIAAFDGSGLTDEVLAGFGLVHFAGIYLQENFRPVFLSVLERCRKLGVATSLDPQWDATEKWEGMADWLPLLDYFFVNDAEAKSVTKTDDPVKACLELAELTKCPVVKCGAEGCLIHDDGRVIAVPVVPVEVRDTIGAGDTFDAAFLFAARERGASRLEAAHFANTAGARNCQFEGGVAARSSEKDILTLMGDFYAD